MKKWLVLAFCAVAACREEAQSLTAEDLARLLSRDRSISFTRFHIAGTARLHADGSFEAVVPRLGQDSGAWWLEEDAICSRWATFRPGRKLCATVGRLPDGTYRGFSPVSGAFLGAFRFTD